jgi:hypothetical protein
LVILLFDALTAMKTTKLARSVLAHSLLAAALVTAACGQAPAQPEQKRR